MLVKLLPDQVSRQWEAISYAIKESLPPFTCESNEGMNNILMSIMSGGLVCWASTSKDGILNGIVTTMIVEDFASRIKNLLVYTIWAYENTDREVWVSGLKTLIKYGGANGCESVIGYTSVPSLVDFINRCGGDTSFTFAKIPIAI